MDDIQLRKSPDAFLLADQLDNMLPSTVERKWSYDLAAANSPVVGASAYEVLHQCPWFFYVRFLLAGRPNRGDYLNEKSQTTPHVVESRNQWMTYLRCLLPSVLLVMLLIDICDWFLNWETALSLQQTRIISIFTYLDSQFVLWLGTATTFMFIAKSNRLIHCAYSLGTTRQLLGPNNDNQTLLRPIYLKSAWCIFTCLAASSIYRAVHGIWDVCDSFQPRRYFVWTVPSGMISMVLKMFFLVSELSALPVYIVFIFMCAQFAECFARLSGQIKALLHQIDRRSGWPTTAEAAHYTSVAFVDELKALSLKEVTLTQSLMDLDECFAVQILCFVVNNSLGIFSKIAKCFIPGAFEDATDVVKFAMKSAMYVLSLVTLIAFPAMLNESSSKSISLWQRLIAVRQQKRGTDYCPEESEILITLLQRTTARKHCLTVAGIANLTRSFGVTLLLGFAGFTCFLIDRAENYEMDDELIEKSAVCNCSSVHVTN